MFSQLKMANLQSKRVEMLQADVARIRKSKIRGEVSEGMICSLAELGFDSQCNGIWEIPAEYDARPGEALQEQWFTEYDTLELARAPFEDLLKTWAKVRDLRCCIGLLAWDEQTNMPQSAQARRGEVTSTVSKICHELTTSPEYATKLDAALKCSSSLNMSERYSCERALETYERESAVPADLVAEHALRRSECLNKWAEAKAANNFKVVAASLEALIGVSVEIERLKMQAGGKEYASTYDSMLNTYARGFSEEEIGCIFGELKASLKELLKNLHPRWRGNEGIFVTQDSYPEHAQLDLARYVADTIMAESKPGGVQLDTSAHPTTFPIDSPYDVRITTAFNAKHAVSGMMATIHECGHALYELGLPKAGLPAGNVLIPYRRALLEAIIYVTFPLV